MPTSLKAQIDTAIWLDDDTEPKEPVGNALAELRTQGELCRLRMREAVSDGYRS
jgi:hypothetical protein